MLNLKASSMTNFKTDSVQPPNRWRLPERGTTIVNVSMKPCAVTTSIRNRLQSIQINVMDKLRLWTIQTDHYNYFHLFFFEELATCLSETYREGIRVIHYLIIDSNWIWFECPPYRSPQTQITRSPETVTTCGAADSDSNDSYWRQVAEYNPRLSPSLRNIIYNPLLFSRCLDTYELM